jgi:hypothetical protein
VDDFTRGLNDFLLRREPVRPRVDFLQQLRPDIEIAPPKPPDVGIGRKMSTLTAQPCIGLIQLGGCELHGRIMTENGD